MTWRSRRTDSWPGVVHTVRDEAMGCACVSEHRQQRAVAHSTQRHESVALRDALSCFEYNSAVLRVYYRPIGLGCGQRAPSAEERLTRSAGEGGEHDTGNSASTAT